MNEKKLNYFLTGLFIVTIATSIIPFWIPDFLPFLDIPQHLSIVSVIHNFDNPFFSYNKFFYIDYGATQYLFYYFFCHFLSFIFSIDVANKIFLSLYAIVLPISIYIFLYSFNREKWGCFFSIPFIYNPLLFMGFLNFVFGVAVLFLCLSIFKMDIDKPSTGKKIFLLILTIVLFHCHMQVFLLYLVSIPFILLFLSKDAKKILLSLSHLIPSFCFFVFWIFKILFTPCEIWERGEHGQDIVWEGVSESFSSFFNRIISVYPPSFEEWCLFILIIFFGIILILKRTEKSLDERKNIAPEIISLIVIILYFISPISYKWYWLINSRFAPIFALFLPSWINKFTEFNKRLIFIPVGILTIYLSYIHGVQFRKFNEETKDFEKILETMEPHKRVMSLIFDSNSWNFNEPVYLHFGQYYQLKKGGVVNFSFSNFPPSPVRFRKDTGPPLLPLRFEWTPQRFDFKVHGGYYDYFLLRGGYPQGVFKDNIEKVHLIARYGRWSVYKKNEK